VLASTRPRLVASMAAFCCSSEVAGGSTSGCVDS
jgi:hypothetical protein